MPPNMAGVVAGSVALTIAIVFFVWLIVRSGKEVARASLQSGEPFRMTADVAGAKVLTLWCDVALDVEGTLSLTGPMSIEADGRRIWSGDFSLDPMGGTRAGTMVRVKKTWIRGFRGVRGQARIAKLDAPPGNSSITVEGTVTAGPGTTVKKLDIFLGAR